MQNDKDVVGSIEGTHGQYLNPQLELHTKFENKS